MEMNGHECVAFCEIDKFARQSYKAIYDTEGEEEIHDITKWTDEHIREFKRRTGTIDCITGGFPCQSFSTAGKRGGFNDTRGTLFFEIMRIANIIRPRYLFLENVKGLLNHDRGATFETILNTLDEFGYDAEWQVLNSKDFGVPQNRERIFIIGHLRGAGGRTVFPVGATDGETNIPIKQVAHRKGFANSLKTYSPDGITGTLDTAGGGGRELHVAIQPVLTPDRLNKRQNGRRFKEDGEQAIETFIENSCEYGDTINAYNRTVDNSGLSPTLTTRPEGFKTAILPITSNLRIRKLTPLECWRLQGFTDEQFYKAKNAGVSNSQLYKQAGNSVTVSVIDAIAKKF